MKLSYFIFAAKMIYLDFKLKKELNNNYEEWYNPYTGKSFIVKTNSPLSEEQIAQILQKVDILEEEFNKI